MIESKYNKEENIIYLKRIGDIALNDLLNNIRQIDENFNGLTRLNIFEDIRESTSKFSVKDYPIIIEEIKKRIGHYTEVRCAVLAANPKNTALSILYEMISSLLANYKYKTFTTKEAAINWLKQNTD